MSKIFKTLEFHRITDQVASHTRTEHGTYLVVNMKPTHCVHLLNYLQAETEQALALIEAERTLPIPELESLQESMKRLEIGAILNGKELSQIGRLLGGVRSLKSFFEDLEDEEDLPETPQLLYWVDQTVALPEIERSIERTVDHKGNILSTASRRLGSIRRKLQNKEQQVRKILNDLLQSRSNELSDALVTMRNDRYVLPVKAEFRNNFGGNVHDQSSTGQTIYIEPQAVVKLNNERADLQVDERQEIDRILREITQQLIPYHGDIELNEQRIGQLDFINARALYARDIQGIKPGFSTKKNVRLYQARHPLIDPNDIVPNDIFIGENYQTLIITGPNTGGKTIVLKTLGLLQLMGQSGLHIPAAAKSQLGVFDQIYADIGDEQSIEQSLSTFSSHMTNIVSILEHATHHSLILFDELGSGTDPQEGASLAVAILNHTRKIGCIVMATTHYPELKVYADQAEGTINASVEFNNETLSPTYHLLIGVPGRSNALDISKRLGLDPSILQEAKEGISQDSQTINEMVENLEKQRRLAKEKYEAVQEELAESQKLYSDLKKVYEEFHQQREHILDKARQEANQQVEEARQEADKIISEIRSLQLEQGQQVIIKESTLQDKQAAMKDLKQEAPKKTKNRVLRQAQKAQELTPGEEVEVLSYGQRGTVVEKRGKDQYVVQMGILKMSFNREDLKPLQKKQPKRTSNVQRGVSRQASTQLDLRGQRYEEAMRQLDSYLDTALLSNHPHVTIIHGHGTGAIREGVQQALKRHPQVAHFEYSHPNSGGQGSTVAHFK